MCVWARNGSLPVRLDKILQLLAVSSLGIGDIVIGEPSLEFSLVPFVICCPIISLFDLFRSTIDNYSPALVNQVLPSAVSAARATTRAEANENLIATIERCEFDVKRCMSEGGECLWDNGAM